MEPNKSQKKKNISKVTLLSRELTAVQEQFPVRPKALRSYSRRLAY